MVPDHGWVDTLNNKWDLGVVKEEASKFSELKIQAETEQRPHKVSFYVDKSKVQEVTKELSQLFEKRGLDVKIIYSGGMDLDILPQGAGKGQALAYLLKKLKTEGKLPVNTLARGDSENDAELFSIPHVYGVMVVFLFNLDLPSTIFVNSVSSKLLVCSEVSNAQEELLKWHAENAKDNPKERCAGGIIEAVGHFKLGPNLSPRDVSDFLDCKTDNINPRVTRL